MWSQKRRSSVTQLRQMVLDELQRRNYAPITIKQYLRIIDEFAAYFGLPVEKLGPNHIRVYQAHLFRDRKLASRTVRQHVAALRFLFVKTLKRPTCWSTSRFRRKNGDCPSFSVRTR